jgi:hypothetical protein
MKTEVGAFRGIFPGLLKTTSENTSNLITKPVSDFDYLRCNVTHNYDGDLCKKTYEF